MPCRDIPKTPVASYDSIQQMYIGVGVNRLSTGVHRNVDVNLPTAGLDLTAMTPEAIDCFNALAGIDGGTTYNRSPLHGNIRELRQLVDYFKGRGNTGDKDHVTGEEIDAYVTAFANGKTNFNAQEYRELTVANLAAYINLVEYVGGGTPSIPAQPTPTEALSVAIRSYGSVQQMFTGLVGDLTGTTVRSSVSEEIPTDGIALGVLTEANVERFKEAIGWSGPEPTTPLARNAKEILDLAAYFRAGGNRQGEPVEMVSATEIDAYVRAYVRNERSHGNRTITFDNYRPVAVGNLRALAACVQYVTNPPALPAAPRPIVVPAMQPSLSSRIGHWFENHWQPVVGFGVGALILGALGALAQSRRQSAAPTGPAAPATAGNPPPPLPPTSPTREDALKDYNNVIINITQQAPEPAPLEATPLAETPAAVPFQDILTAPVDDAAIDAALRQADPTLALADFYRVNVSHQTGSVHTVGDLIRQISRVRTGIAPDFLAKAQAAIGTESANTGRVVFELLAQATGWQPADLTGRPNQVAAFEERYNEVCAAAAPAESAEVRLERELREFNERVERDARLEGR